MSARRLAPLARVVAVAVVAAGAPALAGGDAPAATVATVANPGGGTLFEYKLYLGGFHVLNLNTRIGLADDAYSMGISAQTAGFVARLVDAGYDGEVAGRAAGARVRPARFLGISHDGDEDAKSVTLTWRPDKPESPSAPAVAFDPPDAAPDEALPEDMIRDTVDPASAMLALMETVGATGTCDTTARVFDGRRRYDLVARHVRDVTLSASRRAPYDGPAVECAVTIKRLAGFRKTKLANRYPDTIVIYLARVLPDAPPVPVRLQAKNLFGTILMHLARVTPAGGEQAALSPE